MTAGRQRIQITRNTVQVFGSILFCGAIALSWLHIGSSLAQAPATRVEVTATRFAFSPTEITLKQGMPVALVMESTDVAHGLRIRELGVELRAPKGQSAETTFTPRQTGNFIGRCSVFCGSGHGRMTLVVHVVQ